MLLYGYDVRCCDDFIPLSMKGHAIDLGGYPVVDLEIQQAEMKKPPIKEMIRCEYGTEEYTDRSNYYFLSSEKAALNVTKNRIQYWSAKEESAEERFLGCLKPGLILLSKFYNRPVLHGNAILYHGSAYLFLAPSGLGKSTITHALYRYSDAEVLADDLIILSPDGVSVGSGSQAVWRLHDGGDRRVTEFGVQEQKKCETLPLKNIPLLLPEYPIRATVFLEKDVPAKGIDYKILTGNDYMLRLLRNMRKPLGFSEADTQAVWQILRKMAMGTVGISMGIARGIDKLKDRVQEITELFDGVEQAAP